MNNIIKNHKINKQKIKYKKINKFKMKILKMTKEIKNNNNKNTN